MKSLTELLFGPKGEQYKHAYFGRTTQQLARYWRRKAKRNKAKGFDLPLSLDEPILPFNEAELAVRVKYYYPTYLEHEELKLVRSQLADIKANLPQYIEAEQKATAEADHQTIDKLEAEYKKMESELNELEEIFENYKIEKDGENKSKNNQQDR